MLEFIPLQTVEVMSINNPVLFLSPWPLNLHLALSDDQFLACVSVPVCYSPPLSICPPVCLRAVM